MRTSSSSTRSNRHRNPILPLMFAAARRHMIAGSRIHRRARTQIEAAETHDTLSRTLSMNFALQLTRTIARTPRALPTVGHAFNAHQMPLCLNVCRSRVDELGRVL